MSGSPWTAAFLQTLFVYMQQETHVKISYEGTKGDALGPEP
jgi:hypothetical protein